MDEESGQGNGAERGRVLGEEEVRRRAISFLKDRRSEVCRSGVSDGYRNSCLLDESVDERLDEILASARIDGQVVVIAIG